MMARRWMRHALAAGTGLLALMPTSASMADVAAMGRLTKSMVLEARDYYLSVSFEEAREAFNDRQSERWLRQPFHLHMFGMDADGIVWADNIFHEFVGVDFNLVHDLEGVAFGKKILERTAGTTAPFEQKLKFISPETGDAALSIGHCLRPDPSNVICAWSEQE